VIRTPKPDLSTCTDSPYALELRRDSPKLRFAPELESEYLRSRLLDSQTLIRMACIAAIGLTVVRGFEQGYEGLWSTALCILIGFIVASSVLLAMLTWSSRFERLYPKWARIVVPARNSLVAIQVAAAAARGQPEMLILLPITFIGPFFFLGLPLRTSIVCCLITSASYMIFAQVFALPTALAWRSDVLLLAGAIVCIVALWNLEKISRRSFLEGRLIAELAQRDALTGARNRRVFDEHLQQVWQHAIDTSRPMALLLIDIDHFKAYNDHYGHQAGDLTLRRVAEAVQKFVCRPLDILTRYGGEEFAAILYDVDSNQAGEIAERMRQAVADMAIEHRASRSSTGVTISVGVAAIQPTRERTAGGAVQLADQALYEAKVQGRNRVELMDNTHHSLLVTGVFRVGSGKLRA
jgi:diguanylate cyclase (GGDEF)-like protein